MENSNILCWRNGHLFNCCDLYHSSEACLLFHAFKSSCCVPLTEHKLFKVGSLEFAGMLLSFVWFFSLIEQQKEAWRLYVWCDSTVKSVIFKQRENIDPATRLWVMPGVQSWTTRLVSQSMQTSLTGLLHTRLQTATSWLVGLTLLNTNWAQVSKIIKRFLTLSR